VCDANLSVQGVRASGAGPRRGHPLSPLHCYVTILPLLYIFYIYIHIIFYIYISIHIHGRTTVYMKQKQQKRNKKMKNIYIYIYTHTVTVNIYIYIFIYLCIYIYIHKKVHIYLVLQGSCVFWCHLFLALTYGSLFSLDLFQYPLLLSHLRSKRDYPRGCGRGRCAGSRRETHP